MERSAMRGNPDCALTRSIRATLPISRPWPPRRVANMEYSHPVIEYAVKDLIRIPDQRNDVYPRPFDNACSHFGTSGDVGNNLPNASFDGGGHGIAESAAFGGNLEKVSCGTLGELDLHRPRNDLNAASTSSSLAKPLRSASSSAANSSGLA